MEAGWKEAWCLQPVGTPDTRAVACLERGEGSGELQKAQDWAGQAR